MGLENLGAIMAWKYPELRNPFDYRVEDTGSGPQLVWTDNPGVPDPAPSALEVMAFEAEWQTAAAAAAAEATQSVTDKAALLASADGAITDLTAAVEDLNGYLNSAPLTKTAAEVREQVRDNCVILRGVAQILRETVRVLKYAVKQKRL